MSEFETGQSETPELPDGLRRALVGLHEPAVSVPREIDHAVLRDARLAFGRRRRLWIGTRWAAAVLAAAAMVVIAVRLFVNVPSRQEGGLAAAPGVGSRPQLAQLADVNRDNRVNILDAYVVARHIARGEALDPAWDVNGDGVVDQKDVDLIANLAVQASDLEQP